MQTLGHAIILLHSLLQDASSVLNGTGYASAEVNGLSGMSLLLVYATDIYVDLLYKRPFRLDSSSSSLKPSQ